MALKGIMYEPAVLLLEDIEMHFVVVEVVVGVEHLRDGLVDAGEDLLLVGGHTLHPLLGHEEGDPVTGVVAGEADGRVDHLQRHIQAWPVFLPEAALGHLQKLLQTRPGSGDMVPG